jgi:hypothetical protein
MKAMMTLEARSDDVRSLKGDAGWRRESSWSSRHGPAPLRFFILNPAMHQGQAVASGWLSAAVHDQFDQESSESQAPDLETMGHLRNLILLAAILVHPD